MSAVDLMRADVMKALACLQDSREIEVKALEPGLYRWRTAGGAWSDKRYLTSREARQDAKDSLVAVAIAFLERVVPPTNAAPETEATVPPSAATAGDSVPSSSEAGAQ